MEDEEDVLWCEGGDVDEGMVGVMISTVLVVK